MTATASSTSYVTYLSSVSSMVRPGIDGHPKVESHAIADVGSPAVPVLDAQHDLAHAVGDDPTWSESYYFNAYAPSTDCGFFTRVGLQPNAGHRYAIVGLWLPDGGYGRLWFEGSEPALAERRIEVGGVAFEVVEPL